MAFSLIDVAPKGHAVGLGGHCTPSSTGHRLFVPKGSFRPDKGTRQRWGAVRDFVIDTGFSLFYVFAHTANKQGIHVGENSFRENTSRIDTGIMLSQP